MLERVITPGDAISGNCRDSETFRLLLLWVLGVVNGLGEIQNLKYSRFHLYNRLSKPRKPRKPWCVRVQEEVSQSSRFRKTPRPE